MAISSFLGNWLASGKSVSYLSVIDKVPPILQPADLTQPDLCLVKKFFNSDLGWNTCNFDPAGDIIMSLMKIISRLFSKYLEKVTCPFVIIVVSEKIKKIGKVYFPVDAEKLLEILPNTTPLSVE
ncbi:MAG: hypothetical protein LBQ54_04280 [Planctomycetaceae bacterium]|jgi:hypothetical protein|nr:hypothetical protein [Planctomycetaceae bacterium]